MSVKSGERQRFFVESGVVKAAPLKLIVIRNGFCLCGCGQRTNKQRSNRGVGYCKFISGHNRNGKYAFNWKGHTFLDTVGRVRIYCPSHPRNNNGYEFEHIIVAELALGKLLPKKAVIHHVDGDPANNSPKNLVICENSAYHMLLHRREKALKSCGNPNFRKCPHCQIYDNPENMRLYQDSFWHYDCRKEYQKWSAQKARNRKHHVNCIGT